MNESLDLRNRILKMRESNKIVMDEFKLETKTLDAKSKVNSQNNQNNLNKKEDSLQTRLEKDSSPLKSEKIMDADIFKKKSTNTNVKNEKNSNKPAFNSLVNDNEAQFRIIAKKFNEAVEVILELSDKVKNLEETVNSLSMMSSKNKKKYSFFDLKNFVLIIITTFILLGLFTLPIDFTLIKLIIADVISSI